MVIPIALAVSLVFAGFAVFAREAENFVVRVNAPTDVSLALTFNRDLSEQTTQLLAPVNGKYMDVTYTPSTQHLYQDSVYSKNLPDDIAKYDGSHSVYRQKNQLSFFSFSFYLVNNSTRAVDIDMELNIDELVVKDKNGVHHVDGAVRVMLIEGEPLLSDNTYMIYKKEEVSEEDQKVLDENVAYGKENVAPFLSDKCVMKRTGDTGYKSVGKGETLRFTIVIWLEGWDVDCIDEIRYDSMKMSMDFTGY